MCYAQKSNAQQKQKSKHSVKQTKSMRLLADGGSTKIEWLLIDDDKEVARCITPGLNPTLLSESELVKGLAAVASEHPQLLAANSVEFYGSGCTPAASAVMKGCLKGVFLDADTIIVDSDIIGAAKSVCADKEGIACILGTGANSCLWDGQKIIRQTPALGYILGDEGSGAVLGKLFINAMYKGVLPHNIREEFEKEYNTDMFGVIGHVYREPQPNRWLASLSVFIGRHLDVPEVEKLVCDNFDAFFQRNILPYNRPDLPVSFVGSIAYYYENQLRSVAAKRGITIGVIKKAPL